MKKLFLGLAFLVSISSFANNDYETVTAKIKGETRDTRALVHNCAKATEKALIMAEGVCQSKGFITYDSEKSFLGQCNGHGFAGFGMHVTLDYEFICTNEVSEKDSE